MNPGSPEAIEAGCTCPNEPNRGGSGAEYSGTHQEQDTSYFLIAQSCKLHGEACWQSPEPATAA